MIDSSRLAVDTTQRPKQGGLCGSYGFIVDDDENYLILVKDGHLGQL